MQEETLDAGMAAMDKVGAVVLAPGCCTALRCQGYALVEEHRLDDAEARYRDALAVDPNDAKAKGERTYIAQQRASH